jgi:hypothetical protein
MNIFFLLISLIITLNLNSLSPKEVKLTDKFFSKFQVSIISPESKKNKLIESDQELNNLAKEGLDITLPNNERIKCNFAFDKFKDEYFDEETIKVKCYAGNFIIPNSLSCGKQSGRTNSSSLDIQTSKLFRGVRNKLEISLACNPKKKAEPINSWELFEKFMGHVRKNIKICKTNVLNYTDNIIRNDQAVYGYILEKDEVQKNEDLKIMLETFKKKAKERLGKTKVLIDEQFEQIDKQIYYMLNPSEGIKNAKRSKRN